MSSSMTISTKQYPNNQKLCTKCKLTLSVEEFYLFTQNNGKDKKWLYRAAACIKCMTSKRKQRKKEAVEYLGGVCKDCDLKDECVDIYDFHHLDPNEKDFAIGKNNSNFNKIKKELDKCILLCANCHRRRHSK